MIKMKDVALHAGVSTATVSNVLTGKKYVSPEVTEKVKKSIEELGYSVNLIARGLKTNRTNVVGVLLPDITNMIFPDVLKGILDAAQSRNYTVNFMSSNYDFEQEKTMVRYLRSTHVDGIIIDSYCKDKDRREWAKKLCVNPGGEKFPVVSLEQELDDRLVSSVRVRHYDAVKDCVKYLADIGCKKIVHISGEEDTWIAMERMRGYRDAMHELNLPVNEESIISSHYYVYTAYSEMKKLLSKGVSVDGVVACNDRSAIGAIRALREAGLRVPEDVKVTGFDDLQISRIISPKLTTINVPLYEMGKRSFEIIYDQITGNSDIITELLDGSMQIRESTGVEGDKCYDPTRDREQDTLLAAMEYLQGSKYLAIDTSGKQP